jgi:hypothetical protein
MVDGTPQDYHDDLGGALDFSGPGGHEESPAEAWDDFAPPAEPEVEDTGADLDALQSLTEADEEHEDLTLFKVANPSKSVTVTAMLDGRIQFVELTDKVERMSESQLADEIFVLADLARYKAQAGQHTVMFDHLSDTGESPELFNELVSLTLNLPTPEEAAAKEEEVFAKRYFSDKYGDDD